MTMQKQRLLVSPYITSQFDYNSLALALACMILNRILNNKQNPRTKQKRGLRTVYADD